MTTTPSSNSLYLSKTLFIRGLQCHKCLYLHKSHPALKDETTDEHQAKYEAGYEAGELALQLYPGGVMIPYDGHTHDEQLERTREEIEKGTQTIYEATFTYDDIFIKIDILHHGAKGWEIYEVKSSATVNDVHLNDAALQLYVLQGAGLSVAKVSIVHIDNSYVRSGPLNIKKLFAKENVTKSVLKRQDIVAENIRKLRAMLQGEMPAISIGPHCEDPYACDFSSHCWKHIPEDSVFDLRGRGIDKFELYGQGIIRQQDIPFDMLNSKQRHQVESTLNRRDTINREALQEFLKSLWHPICFLDFETFQSAVPLFDGTRPYQQIPFQYSLHVQEKLDSEVTHYEFLARPGRDPREGLLRNLLDQIPSGSCVLTYNQSFEIGVLERLAEKFPKYNKIINMIVNNIRDLMIPFRNHDLYLWQMKGSYSLKAVLPALIPEMSYDGLEISDGGMAGQAYFTMCDQTNPRELENIRTALLQYCKLDTLSMVKIVERIQELLL